MAKNIKGIHRTKTTNTEANKDMRHFNHCLLTSKIIHETGRASNVRNNNMKTIVSNIDGTVVKSKQRVSIKKANKTGNDHQYLMIYFLIFIDNFMFSMFLQI